MALQVNTDLISIAWGSLANITSSIDYGDLVGLSTHGNFVNEVDGYVQNMTSVGNFGVFPSYGGDSTTIIYNNVIIIDD